METCFYAQDIKINILQKCYNRYQSIMIVNHAHRNMRPKLN